MLIKNCIFDPVGKKSSNRWRTGGPLFFPNGAICGLCNSAGGAHATENSDTINLIC